MQSISQHHKVKKQCLDLKIGSHIQSFELQNRLSTLYRSKIIPLIEEYCNQLSDSNTLHRIDFLEIDLGEIDLQTLETDFVLKLADQLSQKLAESLPTQASSSLPHAPQATGHASSSRQLKHTDGTIGHSPDPRVLKEPWDLKSRSLNSNLSSQPSLNKEWPSSPSTIAAQLELVSYFLQTGLLPWWTESLSKQDLEDCVEHLLESAPVELGRLLQTHLKPIQPLQRLIHQCSDSLLFQLIGVLEPNGMSWVRDYNQDLHIVIPHTKSLRGISGQQLRLHRWSGLFAHLRLDADRTTTAESGIWSNLCHLATSLHINEKVLFEEIGQAIEQAHLSNLPFRSVLPTVVTTHIQSGLKTPNIISNVPSFAQDNQNTTSLSATHQPLSYTSPKPFPISLTPQLSKSVGELSESEIKNYPAKKFDHLSEVEHKDRLTEEFEQPIAVPQTLKQDRTRPNALQPLVNRQSLTSQQQLTSQQHDRPTETLNPEFSPSTTQFPSPPSSTPMTEAMGPALNSLVSSFSESNEIYVDNAGLVILWPFLSHFWAGLNLVQGEEFVDALALERAVLLLQYLVEPSLEIPEHRLPLNKVLCGMDLLASLPSHLDITDPEQAECEALLNAVIHNWRALKQTTIEGLRAAFLQRAGILKRYNGNWLLQVERQTYDVLLDQMPWGFHVVKLPWMTDMLHVEW